MNEQDAWYALLQSAARMQREVPGAVLVGGTAVALLARHRYSTDADHVVADLKNRYDKVLQHLEGLDGWVTSRRVSRRPVTILGSMDGMLAGLRQLRRTEPLATQTIRCGGQDLTIPTYGEILRIKAYLLLTRNYSRDHVDFLALARPLSSGMLQAALAPFERLYGSMPAGAEASGAGMVFDLGTALQEAEPRDHPAWRAHRFDAMHPHEHAWDAERIRQEGAVQGERVLDLWRKQSDGAETRAGPTESPARALGL